MEKSVLFVCTGNTCRSPLAEAWFNKRASECGLTGFTAKSAGLFAAPGSRASENSQTAAAEQGASLEEFRSQQLTEDLVKEAFLIVGMTDAHCRKIISALPETAGKIRRMSDFNGGDISDPYGGTLDVYRECFKSIQSAVDDLILDIKNNKFN